MNIEDDFLEEIFLDACKNGNLKIFNDSIKCRLLNLNYKNIDGWTPLMMASIFGHTLLVEKLIQSGVCLDIQDNEGWTALMWATKNNFTDIVELLVKSGSDINIVNDFGRSSFDISVSWNKLGPMLVLNPEALNNRDENGNTLLIKSLNNISAIDTLFLYEKGANFYIENNFGESAFDMLNKKDNLLPELQALKEKLLLEKELSNDNQDNSFSL